MKHLLDANLILPVAYIKYSIWKSVANVQSADPIVEMASEMADLALN